MYDQSLGYVRLTAVQPTLLVTIGYELWSIIVVHAIEL